MNWLDILKNEAKEITINAAYDLWPPITNYKLPFFNHRYEHFKQVEKEARKLLSVYGGDEEIVIASVWVHDRFKPQFDGDDHGNKSADWVLQNLEAKGFPKEKIEAVAYSVRSHCGWTISKLDTIEAKILWDADKLAHAGPSYLFDTIFIFTSQVICDNDKTGEIKFNETISLENLLPVLKRMKCDTENNNPDNKFYLDESKKIYLDKIKAVNNFVDALEKQY